MYIEVFLLDNFLMDAFVLRTAAALCASKISTGRVAAFALVGTAYAAASLAFVWLGMLPVKLLMIAVMSVSLKPADARGWVRAFLCIAGSACVTGGMAFAIALADGGGFTQDGVLTGGVKLHAALLAAGAAAFLPPVVRKLRQRRTSRLVKVYAVLCGERITLRGLVDTGSSLAEPISGRPVIAAYLPEFVGRADIPVPTRTVTGEKLLYAMKPDALIIGTRASDALIAPLEEKLAGTEALIPYMIFGEAE